MFLYIVATLSVLFVVYGLVLRCLLQRHVAAIREAGLPITLAELNDWYTKPEGQNAADVYCRAFEGIPENLNSDDTQSLELAVCQYRSDKSFDHDTTQRLESYLAQFTDVIALLTDAAKIEGCRYPGNVEEGYALLLPHLGCLMKGARILRMQSVLHSLRGEYDHAAEDCLTGIALGNSLRNEPILISNSAGRAIYEMMFEQAEVVVASGCVSKGMLKRLAEVIDSIDTWTVIARAVVGERCFGMNAFDNPGTIPSGHKLSEAGTLIHRLLGLEDFDKSYFLKLMQSQADYIKDPYWPSPTPLNLPDQLPAYCRISRHIVHAFAELHRHCFENESRRRVTLVGIAVEQYRQAHGQLPARLQDLVPAFIDALPDDPFTNQPLCYRLEGDGAIVYSTGYDAVDNGGRRKSARGVQNEEGTDITFTFGDLQEKLWPSD